MRAGPGQRHRGGKDGVMPQQSVMSGHQAVTARPLSPARPRSARYWPGRGRCHRSGTGSRSARHPGADVGRHGAAGRPLPAGQRRVGGHCAGPLPVRPQRPVRPAERAALAERAPRCCCRAAAAPSVRRGVRADAPRDRRRAGHRRLAARAELVRGTAGHLRCQLPRVRAVGAGHGPAAGAGRGHRPHRPAPLREPRTETASSTCTTTSAGAT